MQTQYPGASWIVLPVVPFPQLASADSLLLEAGDNLLLETGDLTLLEA